MGKRKRANWEALRITLWSRSGGRCEVSGRPLDFDTFDAHHRRPKGMGGTYRPDTDTVPNLLALHPEVHNGGPGSVHADRGRSELAGWLLPKDTATPRIFPVWHWTRVWVLLTESGGYVMLPPTRNPPAWEPEGPRLMRP